MTDLELCINKDYYRIWTKYKMMFFKVFNSIMTNYKYKLWSEEDEWLSFCYEKTVMAVDSIKPEKVKNPDTWTIYTQLNRYVFTYAQREINAERNACAFSLDSFIDEHGYDENAALKSEDHNDVDMSIFSDIEAKIIEMRFKGMKWDEIRKKLNIRQKEMKAIQNEIKAKLL